MTTHFITYTVETFSETNPRPNVPDPKSLKIFLDSICLKMEGVYIAGGFFTRILSQELHHKDYDIDVFFRDEVVKNKWIAEFERRNYIDGFVKLSGHQKKHFYADKNNQYLNEYVQGNLRVQAIKRNMAATPELLLRGFDFVHTQCLYTHVKKEKMTKLDAITGNNETEPVIILSDIMRCFAHDKKIQSTHSTHQNFFNTSKRLLKLVSRGWTCEDKDLVNILHQINEASPGSIRIYKDYHNP